MSFAVSLCMTACVYTYMSVLTGTGYNQGYINATVQTRSETKTAFRNCISENVTSTILCWGSEPNLAGLISELGGLYTNLFERIISVGMFNMRNINPL